MWNIEKVVKKGDYQYGVCKDHPKANEHGYVLMHRLVAENKIGRLLSDDEEVHHKDYNGNNNEPGNLEVLTSEEHRKIHAKDRPRKMVELVCVFCSVAFVRPDNLVNNYRRKNYFCSRKCYHLSMRKPSI